MIPRCQGIFRAAAASHLINSTRATQISRNMANSIITAPKISTTTSLTVNSTNKSILLTEIEAMLSTFESTEVLEDDEDT